MTFELASGGFIAMEICDYEHPCENPVHKFRELCGPPDPNLAHAIRPHTLRAEFGVNKVKIVISSTISNPLKADASLGISLNLIKLVIVHILKIL